MRQRLYYVDRANKKFLLAHLLRDPAIESALVFARTRHGADRVVKELEREGVEAGVIHGGKGQTARQTALSRFKSGDLRVLIATDIAARGIDVVGLSHVFNYDLPDEPEVYIHRIGRTGRAGLSGDAVSFCCVDEIKNLRAIEAMTGRRIPTLDSPWPMEVTIPSEPKQRQGRVRKVPGNAPKAKHARGTPRRTQNAQIPSGAGCGG